MSWVRGLPGTFHEVQDAGEQRSSGSVRQSISTTDTLLLAAKAGL